MKTDITGISDILETVSVLKGVKNLFFTLSLLCLLVVGAIFALSRFGMVDFPWEKEAQSSVCPSEDAQNGKKLPALAAVVKAEDSQSTGDIEQAAQPQEDAVEPEAKAEQPDKDKPAEKDDIGEDAQEANAAGGSAEEDVLAEQIDDGKSQEIEKQAAEAVASAVSESQTAGEGEQKQDEKSQKEPAAEQDERFSQEQAPISQRWKLSWRAASSLVKLCNAVLIFSLMMYCLTLLICLKITLIARLGAAYYVTTAFFFALFATVMFMPWQAAFPGTSLAGAMFMPYELACSTISCQSGANLCPFTFYARYAGLWLIVIISLIIAQGRSICWAANCEEKNAQV